MSCPWSFGIWPAAHWPGRKWRASTPSSKDRRPARRTRAKSRVLLSASHFIINPQTRCLCTAATIAATGLWRAVVAHRALFVIHTTAITKLSCIYHILTVVVKLAQDCCFIDEQHFIHARPCQYDVKREKCNQGVFSGRKRPPFQFQADLIEIFNSFNKKSRHLQDTDKQLWYFLLVFEPLLLSDCF